MSGSGRESIPDVWEWSKDPPRCSGGPLECPGLVGMLSRMSGSGREAFLDVWE